MGNANKVQIGLLNLNADLISNVKGSKVINVKDIMYEGNGAKIKVGG
jgi:hypothetical protein